MLTIRNCSRVVVSGNDNRLSAEFSDRGAMTLGGNRNDVAYRVAPGAVMGAVTNMGRGNTVRQQ